MLILCGAAAAGTVPGLSAGGQGGGRCSEGVTQCCEGRNPLNPEPGLSSFRCISNRVMRLCPPWVNTQSHLQVSHTGSHYTGTYIYTARASGTCTRIKTKTVRFQFDWKSF